MVLESFIRVGLFSFYLGYRHGKKKAARRRARQEWWDDLNSVPDEDDPECDNCGHPESRHDDDGNCPSYG